jgi:hypothetical protein
MKVRLYTSVSLGLALSAWPLAGGWAQQATNQSTSLISSAGAEPAAAAETVAVPAPAAEKKLPVNIKPSGPASEVIKLAQAGVDDPVMLTFITNSSSMFMLNSDDIIYLNDIGVANTVVTAMMQHDQELKGYWSNQTSPPAQVAAQPATAGVPADGNPPPSEPQPAPVEAAPAQPTDVNNNYFYDTLAPYGTWVEVEGYGRCWQPTVVVVNRGWQPYCDRGHWVYTDSGWYWMSDYSWGWAAFHYGRWFDHPRWGWCWWPDRVWAPSWVSWRYSSDYCGWAPLPPAAYYRPGFGFSYYGRSAGFGFDFGLGASCFTFVSWDHFRDARPYHHRMPAHQLAQIFNQTTIINNYATGHNNTVINHGIPADRVRERTHTELRPVSIRDGTEAGGAARGGRGERIEHDGRSLVVSRPHIPESAAARPLMSPPPRMETPRVGAPGGIRTQDARPPGRDTRMEGVRERGNRSSGLTPPASGAPAYTRNAPATTVPALSPVTPPPNENRGTPRPREERPDNSNRDRKRDGSQAPTVAPLIVIGSGNARPATQTVPPNSLVVTGHREANPGHTAANDWRATAPRPETPASVPRNPRVWSAPAANAPAQYAATPQIQSPRVVREENRYTPPQQNYAPPRSYPSAPVYAAPSPAPAPRSYPSAPVYSAPPSAPSPARSQNYESHSAPQRSSSGQNRRDN